MIYNVSICTTVEVYLGAKCQLASDMVNTAGEKLRDEGRKHISGGLVINHMAAHAHY